MIVAEAAIQALTFGDCLRENPPTSHIYQTHLAFSGQVLDLTFGAMPSIESIDIASPTRSGAVERSPCYALPLNAEPPACHINDHRLSAGCREAEPAREGFSFEGYLLAQLRSLPPFRTDGYCASVATRYSHFCCAAKSADKL